MAQLENLGGVAQSEVIVIPMIDVSGSMWGDKIGQVNEAMSEVPAQLADINEENLESKLLIAPMQFSNGASWFGLNSSNQPAEVETFRWIDMQANGLTDLGEAFKLLSSKLTVEEKGGWMKGRGGAAPVLILISDGGPTDDYQKPLADLKKRGWFNAAIKFAVAIGDDADKDVLAEFTGHKEAVIESEKIRTDLASIVKRVIVSASKTASKSISSNTVNMSDTVTDNGPSANDQAQIDAITDVTTQLNMDDTDDLF